MGTLQKRYVTVINRRELFYGIQRSRVQFSLIGSPLKTLKSPMPALTDRVTGIDG
jgi:hypothetical protein